MRRSLLALVKGGTHYPDSGGQPLQRLRGQAAAVGSPVSESPGLAGQSVVADMKCEFSHMVSTLNKYIHKRNPWPWNENHDANKQAELEEVQFLPQGGR